jgi:hypothetical protein
MNIVLPTKLEKVKFKQRSMLVNKNIYLGAESFNYKILIAMYISNKNRLLFINYFQSHLFYQFQQLLYRWHNSWKKETAM